MKVFFLCTKTKFNPVEIFHEIKYSPDPSPFSIENAEFRVWSKMVEAQNGKNLLIIHASDVSEGGSHFGPMAGTIEHLVEKFFGPLAGTIFITTQPGNGFCKPTNNGEPIFYWGSIERNLFDYLNSGGECDIASIKDHLSKTSVYLQALAIGCQGYLITKTNPQTGLPRSGSNDPAYVVCRALAAMGWTNYVERTKESGNESILSDFEVAWNEKKLREEVKQVGWWRSFLGNEPFAAIENEWGNDKNDISGWPYVEELLHFISGEPITSDLTEIVANAYCALAQQLK